MLLVGNRMIPARTTVITLGAHDMAAMRAFYRGLGWSEARNSSDAFASFLTSGAILALFPFEHLAEDAGILASDIGTEFRGVTIAMNVESAELVDRTIDELREAGARITKKPEPAWGGRSAYFADPEGNLWEVVWVPGTSFDADGKFVWG